MFKTYFIKIVTWVLSFCLIILPSGFSQDVNAMHQAGSGRQAIPADEFIPELIKLPPEYDTPLTGPAGEYFFGVETIFRPGQPLSPNSLTRSGQMLVDILGKEWQDALIAALEPTTAFETRLPQLSLVQQQVPARFLRLYVVTVGAFSDRSFIYINPELFCQVYGVRQLTLLNWARRFIGSGGRFQGPVSELPYPLNHYSVTWLRYPIARFQETTNRLEASKRNYEHVIHTVRGWGVEPAVIEEIKRVGSFWWQHPGELALHVIRTVLYSLIRMYMNISEYRTELIKPFTGLFGLSIPDEYTLSIDLPKFSLFSSPLITRAQICGVISGTCDITTVRETGGITLFIRINPFPHSSTFTSDLDGRNPWEYYPVLAPDPKDGYDAFEFFLTGGY
ncbi:MAG: hypothetical protein NkDv07_0391 [Candidatus Improbicoccus devescovinae]|nr:MAG: hypothetical protein NkDv07_0391 [Candidatus Improbicoccus devescovinae]